ncbi:MAG: redoxin domain-containing protein [Aquificales bacterium]|nr:redoxin domain-containing protein [Aquificales bacterium]
MMQRKQRVFVLTGILALVFILAACSTSAPAETAVLSQIPASEGAETVAKLRQDVALVAGNLPADFPITIYQADGYQDSDEVMFSELLAEGKPVVLNFWAGLCPPCRVEMPDLQSVSDQYADEILLFGLDVGPFTGLGSNEDARALLQTLSITYPAGTTIDPNVVREYGILGMPTTYFITPDGNIQATWTGLLTREKLTEMVEDLLAASENS